jgi:hypothetical protein
MWVGNNSYRVLDVLNGAENVNNFYTTSFERNEIMICLQGEKVCVNNLRYLNPRETPKKSTLVIKFGTKIYNSDVTNKGRLILQKKYFHC